MTDISAYRTAVLKERIITPLIRRFLRIGSRSFSNLPAMELVLEGLGSPIRWRKPDLSPEDQRILSESALNWLSIAEEAYRVHQGQQSAYYEGFDYKEPILEVASNLIKQETRLEFEVTATAPLHGFLEAIEDRFPEDFVHFMFDESTSKTSQDIIRRVAFQTQITAAYDAATPEFLESLRVLCFAGDYEWRSQVSLLDTVARSAEENPSLSLPAEVMDTVEWAFTGTEDIFDWIDKTSIRAANHLGYSILTSPNADFNEKVNSRLQQLRQWRERIESAALHLTEDPAAASFTRLREELTSNRTPNLIRRAQDEVDRLNRPWFW